MKQLKTINVIFNKGENKMKQNKISKVKDEECFVELSNWACENELTIDGLERIAKKYGILRVQRIVPTWIKIIKPILRRLSPEETW
jgi:hypothetical protein